MLDAPDALIRWTRRFRTELNDECVFRRKSRGHARPPGPIDWFAIHATYGRSGYRPSPDGSPTFRTHRVEVAEPREVVSASAMALRQPPAPSRPTPVVFGPFRLDLAAERLLRGNEPISLRPKTWVVLRHLVEHAGTLVTISELLDVAWAGTAVTPNTLTNVIRELRTALGDDPRSPRFIETAHRRGYRFIGSASTSRDGPPVAPARDGFVGRDNELRKLMAAWRSAEGGARQAAFLSGEPGIGKSTLVDRFVDELTELHARGNASAFRLARAHCVEQHGPVESYGAALELLEQIIHAHDPEKARDFLQKFAPTWLSQIAWLLPSDAMRSLQRSLVGSGAERMQREGAALFEVLSSDTPLVLTLEDLHWSDTATVSWLELLLQRTSPARLLVIATFRPVEIVLYEHPLGAAIQRLRQKGRAEQIHLTPFTDREVQGFLEQRFNDAGIASRLAGRIEELSNGNPLFVDALAGHLLSDQRAGDVAGYLQRLAVHVPEDLRSMIELQLRYLDEPLTTLLETGAVIGAEFTPRIVAEVLGQTESEVDQKCHALARRGQLIHALAPEEWTDDPQGARYQFRHALYHRVLLDRVAPVRRRNLHQKIGECLERANTDRLDEVASALTQHFEAASDHERSARYREVAGWNALRRLRYPEAVDHFEIALGHLRKLPQGREVRLRAVSVLLMQTNTRMVEPYQPALIVQAFRQAEQEAREIGAPIEEFRSLLGQGTVAYSRGDYATLAQLSPRQLAIATSSAPSLLACAYWRAGEVAIGGGHLADGLAAFERSSQLEAEPDVPITFDLRSAVDIAAALTLALQGNLDGSRALRDRAVERSERLGLIYGVVRTLTMACELDAITRERAALAATIERFHAAAQSRIWDSHARLLRIHDTWRLTEGDRDGGDDVPSLREVLRERTQEEQLWHQTILLAEVAEIALRRGDPRAAAECLDEAFATAERGGELRHLPELWRLRGELALSLQTASPRSGRAALASTRAGNEGIAHLEKAIAIATEQGAKLLELRATTSLGRALQRTGQGRDVRARLSTAINAIVATGGSTDVDEATKLLRTMGA